MKPSKTHMSRVLSSLIELIISHAIIHNGLPWRRLPLPLRHQLARIKAPRVLNMLVVLGRVEDHPLLPRNLLVLSVCVPCPEQRACRQDSLAALRALVRQSVGDPLDDA